MSTTIERRVVRAFALIRKIRIRALFGVLLLLSAANGGHAGSTSFTYDAHGRLATQTMMSPQGDVITITYSYDDAGNRTSLVTSTVDTTPPSVPTGLVANVVSATQITLSWTASTDGGSTGVAGYTIRRNGAVIATSGTNSYADNTVVGSSTYQYTVSAYDGSVPVNHSAQSSPVNATTPDTTPPTTPLNLDGYAVDPYWINLSWTPSTDSGGAGLAGYQVFRNGAHIATTTTNSFPDTGLTPSTTYSYSVRAFDGANPPNLSGMSSTIQVSTPAAPDTTPPSVPTGLWAQAVASGQVNLTWNASTDTGGSAVAGYRIYRDGVHIGNSGVNNYTDYTTAGSSYYTYQVLAYDGASPSNSSALSAPVGVTTPDTLGPSTPTGLWISAPASGQVNLSWSASVDAGGGSVAGYRIYRGGVHIANSGTTSFTDYSTAGSTYYYYQVQAYDNAVPSNSSGISEAVGVWTPDTIAPSVPTGLWAESKTSQVTLYWNASSDTGGSGLKEYRVYRNGVHIASPTGTTFTDTGLAQGTTYTYYVSAVDWSNNESGGAVTSIATWIQLTDAGGWVLPFAQALYGTFYNCDGSGLPPVCWQYVYKKYGNQAVVFDWPWFFWSEGCAWATHYAGTGYRLSAPGTCAVEVHPSYYGQ